MQRQAGEFGRAQRDAAGGDRQRVAVAVGQRRIGRKPGNLDRHRVAGIDRRLADAERHRAVLGHRQRRTGNRQRWRRGLQREHHRRAGAGIAGQIGIQGHDAVSAISDQCHIGGPASVGLYGYGNAERSGNAVVGVDQCHRRADHDLAGSSGNGSGNRMGMLRSDATRRSNLHRRIRAVDRQGRGFVKRIGSSTAAESDCDDDLFARLQKRKAMGIVADRTGLRVDYNEARKIDPYWSVWRADGRDDRPSTRHIGDERI